MTPPTTTTQRVSSSTTTTTARRAWTISRNTVSEAYRNDLNVNLEPLQALAEQQARADQWWADYNERVAYEQHVAEHQALTEAREVAEKLSQRAGEKHNVPAAAKDGRLMAAANFYLERAQRAAYDAGDVETLTRLQSPEGAHAAIEEAAKAIHIRTLTNRGLAIVAGRGAGPTPHGGVRY